MTPPDYKETAAKLTGHEDCPHWMDDDHYCRKCEAIGPVLKAITQADALGYARGLEEALSDDDVEWVVNDIAELGVKIRGQFFFLYKGHSYQGGSMWRPVFKREFGEVCHPWESIYYHEKKKDALMVRELTRLPDRFIGYFGEEESDWEVLPIHKTDPCEYEEPCPACARLKARALTAEPAKPCDHKPGWHCPNCTGRDPFMEAP